MILPKTAIFVVYGRTLKIRKITLKAIRNAQREGYRVRSVILDEVTLASARNPSLYNELRHQMSEADAAIILAIGEDRGALGKEIDEAFIGDTINKNKLRKLLKTRARQNVILECGMMLYKVGDKNVLILTDRESEIASDLIGRYWHYPKNDDDTFNLVTGFIKNIAEKTPLHPLTVNSQFLLYSKIFDKEEHAPINVFDEQFSKLDSAEEKVLFLMERIVFDSYIQNPSWWYEKIDSIQRSGSNTIRISMNILGCILQYMRAWRPPEDMNCDEMELICRRLSKIIKNIERHNTKINPGVLIPGYDYLGLAQNKWARNIANSDDKISLLRQSIKSFNKCLALAKKYDDSTLRLWSGYALFNKARSMYALMECSDSGKKQKLLENWRLQMNEAISIRNNWRATNHKRIPSIIRDGLAAEYFYARAERICLAKYSGKRVCESGNNKIDTNYIKKYLKEYEDWWNNPRGHRVRLAANVKLSWDKVKSKIGKR